MKSENAGNSFVDERMRVRYQSCQPAQLFMSTSSSFSFVDEALLQLARAVRETGYRFTTATPATHERVNNRPKNVRARDLSGVFGWSRPFEPEILPPEIWQLMQRAEVAVSDGDLWRSSVRLSSLNDQLFLHSAFPTHDADSVFFGPDTYRFVDAVRLRLRESNSIRRAVDVCCGAGPGALTIAQNRPEADVVGVDINDRALRFTRNNAALCSASNVSAIHSDLLNDVEGEFDFIVANPPYLVDERERAYRHGGGPLGAGLSLKIVEAALQRLAPGGTLLLYTGAAIIEGKDPFRAAVEAQIARANVENWSYREVDPDVFGEELETNAYGQTDRIAAVVLEVTIK